jgi:hypothetical protein
MLVQTKIELKLKLKLEIELELKNIKNGNSIINFWN